MDTWFKLWNDNQLKPVVHAISEGKGKNYILYVLFLIEIELYASVDFKTLFHLPGSRG